MSTKGYNQNQLAELIGVSNVSISRYMTTGRIPRTEELYKIAQLLEVSMEQLLTGRKDEDSAWQSRALAAEKRLAAFEELVNNLGEGVKALGENVAKLAKVASGKE